MSGPAIELEAVVKRYGQSCVVNRVNLTIDPAESLLLVGHNGAGKTTLIKLLLGLIRPSEGRIRVFGDDPMNADFITHRGKLGFLPENVAFQLALTGREVLIFYARLNRNSISRCDELLERVGLQDVSHRRVQTYSKGMRQRLGLAQALLGEPKLLLLDEPTTGLDPMLRAHFLRIIADMQDQGTTTLISSHALNALEASVNRIAILKQGRLLALGTLAQLGQQLALPVKMHIMVKLGFAAHLAESLDSRSAIRQVNNQSVKLECLPTQKMAILKQLSGLGDSVYDLDITNPRLDEIYNFYMQLPEPAPPK